ncbi:MAG: Hpt domain-containing protein [Deltaproteobacteria bacterium]|nr:Hpt domain-containing protein [Deltaproteobacteria bacterium]
MNMGGKELQAAALEVEVAGRDRDLDRAGVLFNQLDEEFEKLRQALREGAAAQVEFQAHSLKGAAMNMGGKELQAAALEVEVAGRERDLGKAGVLFNRLDEEFEKLRRVLIGFVG